MDQIHPAVATSFVHKVQEQVRWLQTHLVMLSPESDSFDSELLAIKGAMNELRKLMQAEPLANDGQAHLCEIRNRIQQEPDPRKMIELAQRLIATYSSKKPLLVNELRDDLTVIVGHCDMLVDAFATQAHILERIKTIKTVALRMADKISHQPWIDSAHKGERRRKRQPH